MLICSLSINCNKDRLKPLKNIHFEFQPQIVPGGIIQKFDELFEDASLLEDEHIDDSIESYLSDPSDEIEEDQYEEDQEYEVEDELASLYDANRKEANEGSLEENYIKFAYKLCVLTAISKETTIYAMENLRV